MSWNSLTMQDHIPLASRRRGAVQLAVVPVIAVRKRASMTYLLG
ncbi:hypothetical protein [Rarobacter incanus]|nr:hypothetical protein [Rarobacter incanus]